MGVMVTTPIGELEIKDVFYAYDGMPMICTGSLNERLYLCICYEIGTTTSETGFDGFYLVPISTERLADLIGNRIPLRDVITEVEGGKVLDLKTFFPTTPATITELDALTIPDENLPKPGYTLTGKPD